MPDGYSSRDWIISAAKSKPTNLVMTRSNYSMELKWGIPLYLVDGEYKKNREISFIDVWWAFNASKDMETRYREVRNGMGDIASDKLWIRDLGTSARSHTQIFDRAKYAPVTPNRFLKSVTGWVVINDSAGHDAVDSECYSQVTYTFKKPYPPVWEDPELDGNVVTCQFRYREDLWTADGYDHERYDTHWQVTRKDNHAPGYKTEELLNEDIVAGDSGTATSLAIDDVDLLSYNQWTDIHFRAWARGIAGDSPKAHVLYTIAWPSKASIKDINVDKNHGLVAVWMKVNASAYHPVDTVELQRLANTNIWTVAMARDAVGWETVAESSDDQCLGLFDTLDSSSKPATGNYTWYRVKTTRCGYVQYSDPVRAKALEQKSPVENDKVKIDSVTAQPDGTSLRVVLGWNWAGQDSNGTEVSWSQYEDAWKSTSAPSTFDLDDDNMDETSQVSGMDASSTLVIRELEEGTPYYIRARRYLDAGDSRIYSRNVCSAPANTYPIAPGSEATVVRLSGPQYVLRGEGAVFTWTFDVEADQKAWHLYRQWEDSGETQREIVASGEDQLGSAVISAGQLGDGHSATFVVGITTGGEWSESDPCTVLIAAAPELELDAVPTLTAQPFGFSFACGTMNADIIAKVSSNGTSSGTPDGELVQAEGDVIWSARFTPAWTDGDDDMYHAEMVLPTGLPFIDGTSYKVELMAVDNATGFTSNVCAARFSVNWSHKAMPPSASSTVTPNIADRSVTIHPIAPSNLANGDVYDIYRVSNDSTDLVAEGQLYGVDAIDRFAPYSRNMTLLYRIATRTADGDVQWADFEYQMPVGAMRFDWADGNFVELPYNISLQDSYEKNYESHQHLDGSVSGHWNPGFRKTGSYSTDIIKMQDADQARNVREMATYPGPVFVRTADGGAFEANVTLGMDTAYSSGALAVSLNVEAHTLSDEFKLGPKDFVSEE